MCFPSLPLGKWGGARDGSERGELHPDSHGAFVRVPLRRHQSLRKKLRAQGQLSEFWKSQNLDMIQFTESCTMNQDANEPLINYLDVRHSGQGLGKGERGGWLGLWAWPSVRSATLKANVDFSSRITHRD